MHETTREQQVLGLLLRGYSNKDIAEQLHISSFTARDHVSALLRKHGVKSRVELLSRYVSGAKLRKILQPPTSVGLCPGIKGS